MLSMVLLLILPVCTSRFGAEPIQDFGRYMTLQAGVSTVHDVYQRFGQPVDVVTDDTGHTWEYLYATMQMHAATCIPYVGLIAGGNTVDMTRALFAFDPQNRYIRVETSRDSRYQNMWVGMAEVLQSTKDAEQYVQAEMARCGIPFDTEIWEKRKEALKLREVKTKEEQAPSEPFGGRR